MGSGLGGARREPGAVSGRWRVPDARVLVVHGVQVTRPIWRGSRRAGTTLVTCPRSNGHTGAGVPPIEEFYASGVRSRSEPTASPAPRT